ncbi:uncharacterized protein LOC117816507 [Notolabrus celidotus]|uniref:uncharacterized protein LOC117816507 n=1 Tax=Notolabrus celidotus TaxID=1203425 RepID=UPI00148FC237|nr:uncharacterized protein LOC117816507 [Notolabrus celidotus]
MKTCAAAVVLLSLFSLGLSAPQTSCEGLVNPITISKEEMLGRWVYNGGSSDIPGSRSLARLMTSVWLDITPTSQENVLNILQTQKIYIACSSLTYNMTFENSIMLMEQPFYLKEVYLPTECPGCLLAYEEIISGNDNFKSLLLFSGNNSVPPAAVEMLKRQAVCLQMPSPLMINTNEDSCPDNITPSEGLSAMNSLLDAKMGQRFARLLDSIVDFFMN